MSKATAIKALKDVFKGKKPKAKKSSTSIDTRSYQERRPAMVKNKRGQTPMEAQGLIDAKGNPLSKPSKSKAKAISKSQEKAVKNKNKIIKKSKGGKISGAPHNRLY